MKNLIGKMNTVKLAVALSLGLGIMAGASGLALGQSVVNSGRLEADTCPEAVLPAAELPDEWVWRTQNVNFDHMYRNAR